MLNQLILGDNLEVLKSLPSESVDLCYIDPPFFSNRNYAVIWGDKGEIRSFEDCWDGGIDTYINWMYKRVTEIHRILKPTGSFYLHCDWHAQAELKVYVLDKIFSRENFLNNISWKRTNAKSNSTKKFTVLQDTIFLYAKSEKCKFNIQRCNYSEAQLSRYKQSQKDEKGLYRCENLTAPGRSKQFEWRGVHPGENRSWSYSLEKLEELFSEGLIVLQKDGRPRKDGLKKYLSDSLGEVIGDVWDDIERVSNTGKERIGYPTQKPEALLERIIKASSNEGDTVLDCFMGGGTTIAVAQKLGRNWIGIDQSPSAFGVTRERILAISKPLFPIEFEAKTAKWDWDNLRKMDDFEFEKLCVKTLGGEPTKQAKGGDLGIDGVIKVLAPQPPKGGVPEDHHVLISVKRSQNIGRNVIDNFKSAIQRYRRNNKLKSENTPFRGLGGFFTLQHGEKINLANYDGFIIAFSFGKGLKAELAQLEREEGFKILPLTVEDILPVAKRPKVILKVECIKLGESGDYKFIATANTDDNRLIEFFAFKVLVKNKENEFENHAFDNFNKTGIFETELKKGEYKVTATATDEYGLMGNDETEITIKGVK